MLRNQPMAALHRLVPFAVTAIVAAAAGAGATVAAPPRSAAEPAGAQLRTTAKVTIKRSGDMWWTASASRRSNSRWRASVRTFEVIESGRYRIRVKFINPFAPDDVRRYVVRVREIR